MLNLQLYTFYQSGSAYRVRIALNLKDLAYEPIFIKGGRNSPELRSEEFRRLNPQGALPALIHNGRAYTQSAAIIEYLDEVYPETSLLPVSPAHRQRVRALAQVVTSDIHPLTTARILDYIDSTLQLRHDQQQEWQRHWISTGLSAMEEMLATDPNTGEYCHGDRPSLADVCLIPQLYTARRFGVDLSGLPTILHIEAQCRRHQAFQWAAPENQPDAPQGTPVSHDR